MLTCAVEMEYCTEATLSNKAAKAVLVQEGRRSQRPHSTISGSHTAQSHANPGASVKRANSNSPKGDPKRRGSLTDQADVGPFIKNDEISQTRTLDNEDAHCEKRSNPSTPPCQKLGSRSRAKQPSTRKTT